MTNPKLALIPSGYKSGKVYSILPNDASGDFDYERNGNATRVRKDGLIEELTVDDTPRLDWYDSDCPSLLLEPSRTNLITYSEDFSEWSPTNIVLTEDVVISPDGTTTADKIAGTSVTLQHRVNFTSTNVSGATTFSFFAKSGEYTSCWARIGLSNAYFDLENGVTSEGSGVTSSIENYGNGWYRCIMTKASSSANEVCRINITTSYLDTSDFLGDNTSGIYLWGAQHEVGDYVSSYIKTEGGIETRLKDECFVEDSNLFDITEGTLFVDATPFKSGGGMEIQISDGTANNRHTIQYQGTGTSVRALTVTGGGTPVFSDYNPLTFDIRNKLAITFKKDEFKFYVNGSLVHTDPLGDVPTGLDKLTFSNPNLTGTFMEGKVYDTRVYDRVLTEAEAIELTT